MQDSAERLVSTPDSADAGLWQEAEIPTSRLFEKGWLLHLVTVLQTTLSIDQLIEVFGEQCATVVDFDGVEFHNQEHGVSIRQGKQARHACRYKILVSDQVLGEIVFRRTRPFKESETMGLEFLSSHLFYPLRNALLYQQALLAAAKDPLTGAFNRSALDNALAKEVSLARRHGAPLSVIMLDLDHFKQVNDRYGHVVGDCALQGVVRDIGRCVRQSDMVFRYGGEEFAVLLRSTDLDGAVQLAERIRIDVAEGRVRCDGAALRLTVSAGVAALRSDEPPMDLIRRADQALYRSKEAGRDRVTGA